MGIRCSQLAFVWACLTALPSPSSAELLDEVVVTSYREPVNLSEHIGNVGLLDDLTISDRKHAHIHELMTRVAGVWISRGSGQESLPAMRSPVLTGAGSCGAFLTLEDGIPSRPSGFCNVNQLFELPTELAQSIEVIQGPANAVYGSNALHGTLNVLLPNPDLESGSDAGIELGANDFVRVNARAVLENRFAGGVVYADDGGFRDASGYQQLKAFGKFATDVADGRLHVGLSVSDLDQETAGFLIGKDIYKDRDLNRQNLNPEAFRDADSQRAYAHWHKKTGEVAVDLRPYIRRSRMTFLQHFLPGQPLEENGQDSAGLIGTLTMNSDKRNLIAGLDVEWADTFLKQTQDGPTEGSAFLMATRPEGKHYDYEVESQVAALFVQGEYWATERLNVSAGARLENVRYEYDNRMLTGNTRDDGTECPFGGCLYSRPADRSDAFTNLVPKAGVLFLANANNRVYLNAARGFRAPQTSELYRLQNGQFVTDLKPEELDSVELGWRFGSDRLDMDLSLYAMRKRNSVLRDAEGFSISNGKSRHRGMDATIRVAVSDSWTLRFAGALARHQYDFNFVAARGETFVDGNDVDTAPRWIGSAELNYGEGRVDAALQWVSLGEYYLDAENEHTYPGHDLLNLRLGFDINDQLSVVARLNNITDEQVADRADFAFGNYRYFPARGRELFLELRLSR